MHEDALIAYEKLGKLQRENEMAHYGVASSLGFLGRNYEAIPHFQRAIQLAPDFIAAHEYLGTAYSFIGRFAEALACYETAMTLAPDSAQLHSELADTYERMGNQEGRGDCGQKRLN